MTSDPVVQCQSNSGDMFLYGRGRGNYHRHSALEQLIPGLGASFILTSMESRFSNDFETNTFKLL